MIARRSSSASFLARQGSGSGAASANRKSDNNYVSERCTFPLIVAVLLLTLGGMLFSNRLLLMVLITGRDDVQFGFHLRRTAHPRPSSSPSHHLLSVPFYIYPELMFLEHGNLTDGNGDPFAYKSTAEYVRAGKKGQPIKHSDDYYFAKWAADHPMRTSDPTEAELFLAPVLLNAVAEALRLHEPRAPTRTICWTPPTKSAASPSSSTIAVDRLCDLDLLKYAGDFLSNSTWFNRKGGKDHLIVGGHWDAKRILNINFPPTSPLRQTSTVTFENEQFSTNLTGRYTAPSMYIGEGCDAVTNKTHDYAFIASMHGKFWVRRELCEGLRRLNSSVVACGGAAMCPALAQARFGFLVMGDTFGANRPMDTLLSETIPLFTHPNQYTILPSFIDWKSLTYFTYFGRKKDCPEWLESVLSNVVNDTEGYESKMSAIRLNRDLYDYSTNVPFELYMYGFQCHLRPETCSYEHRSADVGNFEAKYPAARLPAPENDQATPE